MIVLITIALLFYKNIGFLKNQSSKLAKNSSAIAESFFNSKKIKFQDLCHDASNEDAAFPTDVNDATCITNYLALMNAIPSTDKTASDAKLATFVSKCLKATCGVAACQGVIITTPPTTYTEELKTSIRENCRPEGDIGALDTCFENDGKPITNTDEAECVDSYKALIAALPVVPQARGRKRNNNQKQRLLDDEGDLLINYLAKCKKSQCLKTECYDLVVADTPADLDQQFKDDFVANCKPEGYEEGGSGNADDGFLGSSVNSVLAIFGIVLAVIHF
jgi:hypothetical protein